MMNSSKILPPAYLLITILVMIALHVVLPIITIVSFPWNLLGLLFLGVGTGMNIVASNIFKKANTTIKPFEEPDTLITGGPYRVSRNPMYLGFVLILLGVALLLGSVLPFIIIPGFMILIESNFIRLEEQRLEQKFGSRWLNYRRRVRWWV